MVPLFYKPLAILRQLVTWDHLICQILPLVISLYFGFIINAYAIGFSWNNLKNWSEKQKPQITWSYWWSKAWCYPGNSDLFPPGTFSVLALWWNLWEHPAGRDTGNGLYWKGHYTCSIYLGLVSENRKSIKNLFDHFGNNCLSCSRS